MALERNGPKRTCDGVEDYGDLFTAPTLPEEVELLLPLLDEETLATEALAGFDPLDSIGASRTAWADTEVGALPLACYRVLRDPGDPWAYAWMMTTRHIEGRQRALIGIVSKVLSEHVPVRGVCRSGAAIVSLLTFIGAQFQQSRLPGFLVWELDSNPKLTKRL